MFFVIALFVLYPVFSAFCEDMDDKFMAYWQEILHFRAVKPGEEDMKVFLLEYIKGSILEEVARDMGIEVSSREVEERLREWGKRDTSPLIKELVRREIIARKIEEKITEGIEVSEAEVRAYYLLNRREFYYPAQVKLLRVIARDRKTAEKVRRLLKRGLEVGGLKGVRVGKERWYSVQALPKRVRRKLYPYKVGKVSEPIDTGDGFIILKITAKRKAGVLPLSEVKDRVREKILRMKKREVLREWFRSVLKSYGSRSG